MRRSACAPAHQAIRLDHLSGRPSSATRARAHVFNNLYTNFNVGVDSREFAEVWLEENIFKSGTRVRYANNPNYAGQPGFVRLEDNIIIGGMEAQESPSGVNRPENAYPYYLRKFSGRNVQTGKDRLRNLAGWKRMFRDLRF